MTSVRTQLRIVGTIWVVCALAFSLLAHSAADIESGLLVALSGAFIFLGWAPEAILPMFLVVLVQLTDLVPLSEARIGLGVVRLVIGWILLSFVNTRFEEIRTSRSRVGQINQPDPPAGPPGIHERLRETRLRPFRHLTGLSADLDDHGQPADLSKR